MSPSGPERRSTGPRIHCTQDETAVRHPDTTLVCSRGGHDGRLRAGSIRELRRRTGHRPGRPDLGMTRRWAGIVSLNQPHSCEFIRPTPGCAGPNGPLISAWERSEAASVGWCGGLNSALLMAGAAMTPDVTDCEMEQKI